MSPTIHISKNDRERIEHAHRVRAAVFHQEQGISPDLDIDGQDEKAVQIVAYNDEQPVGTARLRFPYSPHQAKLERLAVLSTQRGKKIGQQIMLAIEEYAQQSGITEIIMNSQLSAKVFYKKLGYEPVGETFEEANIPHIKMKKTLQSDL